MERISAEDVILAQRAYLCASNAARIAVVARAAARLQPPALPTRKSGSTTKQETPATINHEGLTAHYLPIQESEGRCVDCGRPVRQ